MEWLNKIKDPLNNYLSALRKNENFTFFPAKKNLTKGESLDGEGGFTVRGEGVSSQFSKKNNILPLGLSDGLKVKEDIKKNSLITLGMVETNFPKDIKIAREYQYSLIS